MTKQNKKFNQATPQYKSPDVETPYMRARLEWSDRFGSLSAQASNWRLIAILSMIGVLVLLVLLGISFSTNKSKVFVAEVASSGKIVNIAPLATRYQPTKAQEEYFISHFVKLIRELALDPVVAKQNWLAAYNFLTQNSSKILSDYLQKSNPVKLLGKKTIMVNITDINPISNNTFQMDWVETITDVNNQDQQQQKYSGVFTIAIKQPTSQKSILQNPLGLYIVNFNISRREA